MPTFVPVQDPEKARFEQDEAELAKHRQWDSSVIARDTTERHANRGWEQGTVGWGVLGTWGSATRDDGAQVVRRDAPRTMVQNEKGLWVKAPKPHRSDDKEARRREEKEEKEKRRHDRRGRRDDERRRRRRDDDDDEDDYERRRRRRRDEPRHRRRDDDDDDDERRPRDDKPRRRRRDDGDNEERRRRDDVPRRRHRDDGETRLPEQPARADARQEDKREEEPPTDTAPQDFKFTCSQVVDRVLEIFNSDAPAVERRAALGECFGEVKVAPLRTGERPTTMAGDRAVEAIATASGRVDVAEPKIRIFMEPGGPGDDEPIATFCLDVYAANEAPGLSAVVKGTPADTMVLWRCQANRITHAYVAPDRDGLGADWEAVTEDALLASRTMAATNELLASDLPPNRDFWDFYFHNYTTDIPLVGVVP